VFGISHYTHSISSTIAIRQFGNAATTSTKINSAEGATCNRRYRFDDHVIVIAENNHVHRKCDNESPRTTTSGVHFATRPDCAQWPVISVAKSIGDTGSGKTSTVFSTNTYATNDSSVCVISNVAAVATGAFDYVGAHLAQSFGLGAALPNSNEQVVGSSHPSISACFRSPSGGSSPFACSKRTGHFCPRTEQLFTE
jgi:hypothetical protein